MNTERIPLQETAQLVDILNSRVGAVSKAKVRQYVWDRRYNQVVTISTDGKRSNMSADQFVDMHKKQVETDEEMARALRIIKVMNHLLSGRVSTISGYKLDRDLKNVQIVMKGSDPGSSISARNFIRLYGDNAK